MMNCPPDLLLLSFNFVIAGLGRPAARRLGMN